MTQRHAAIAVLGVALIAAGTAAADSKEAYKKGVEAIGASRWATAENFLLNAIAERPQAKFNRVLKTGYLPHYHLGVALAEQGKCRPALAAWTRSQSQGQVQKSARYSTDLEGRKGRCRDQVRQVEEAVTAIERLLQEARDASSSLGTLSRTPELAPLWTAGDASFAARRKGAMGRLEEADRRLAAGNEETDLELLGRSQTLASEALTDLLGTLADARRQLGERNAATANALEQLEKAEQSARQAIRSISDLAPYPRRLRSRVTTVEETLGAITIAKSGAAAQRLDALKDELTESVAAMKRAARRPPKELVQAAEAFFSSDYATVLELLEDDGLGRNPRARPHICLLRAAARHTLWLLANQQDDTLAELAVQDIAACAELEPIEPSPKFFSPRFVEFHRSTLLTLAAAEEAEQEREAASEETEAAPEALP